MSWLDKLYLPPLGELNPMILISVLDKWYQKRQIRYSNDPLGVKLAWDELELLMFLKEYAADCVIAGSSASDLVHQKKGYPYIDVFIPVYGRLELDLKWTLIKMFEKASLENYESKSGICFIRDFHRSRLYLGYNKAMKEKFDYQQSDCCSFYGKDTFTKFVRIRYYGVVMHWIEVEIDIKDIFVKQMLLKTLFTFYLLNSFDIVKCRIAVTNWYSTSVDRIRDIPHRVIADECVDLIYSFPGYVEHMLRPIGQIYYLRGKKHCNTYRKYRGCFKYSQVEWLSEFANHTAFFFNMTLEKLCLAALVSASDFSWVKFKRHFNGLHYCNLQTFKDKILL